MTVMNQIRMRFPAGRSKALTLSYDDGVEQDIRLIELLDKYKVKGTFNLNSGGYAAEGTIYPAGQIHRRMTKAQCTELYDNPLTEVAVHALNHPFLERLTPAMVMKQVVQDRENLENQFGKIIRGMAYPFGTYDDKVVDVLRMAGIAYSRTTHSHHNFGVPSDWLRWGATCHHNDSQLMPLANKFLEDKVERDPYLFYLWGHSYEFEGNNNWNVIEDFLALVSGHDQVWYATNIEVHDYTKAFESLEYSVSGHIVHNPSAITVWAQLGSNVVEVPAGQSVKT